MTWNGAREAVCRLFSHQFGWQLRLEVNCGLFSRSQVCRFEGEVFNTFEPWKAAMIEKRWR